MPRELSLVMASRTVSGRGLLVVSHQGPGVSIPSQGVPGGRWVAGATDQRDAGREDLYFTLRRCMTSLISSVEVAIFCPRQFPIEEEEED